jgi:CheY-like chemotaxis protein
LIVDGSAENREVLRTVLSARGIITWEAEEALAGAQLAHQHQPRVIVVDSESENANTEAVRAEWEDRSRHGSSIVLLGSARPHSEHRVIAKPYHYEPLIRTIEELVAPVHSAAGD